VAVVAVMVVAAVAATVVVAAAAAVTDQVAAQVSRDDKTSTAGSLGGPPFHCLLNCMNVTRLCQTLPIR
jgi:hypothetical protein